MSSFASRGGLVYNPPAARLPADVAQLAERLLAMQKVEGSNPFIRSIFPPFEATWPSGLGTGLQNPLHRFDSGRRLLISRAFQPSPPRGGFCLLHVL